MDGNFVPNLTFGPELIAACRKYTKTPFETQLMVSNYNCDTMLEQARAAKPKPWPPAPHAGPDTPGRQRHSHIHTPAGPRS